MTIDEDTQKGGTNEELEPMEKADSDLPTETP